MKLSALIVCALTVSPGLLAAQTAQLAAKNPYEAAAPTKPARIDRLDIHIDGINAVQLAWWFQHLADDGGVYWKKLSAANKTIEWRVNPREDAHQIIGAMFTSDQVVGAGAFTSNMLHMQLQFQDYITQNRADPPGQPHALNPTLPIPRDYTPPYPSPVSQGAGMASTVDASQNGFNEQLLMLDGTGFSQGRLLVSWRNTGSDDTEATIGKPIGVDLSFSVYQVWMEGANRPATLSADGYYYNDAQISAIKALWKETLTALPKSLPRWFGTETQDDLARAKEWTVTSVIDTGFVDGVDSKMMVWWWNHAMGDSPNYDYSMWCPPAHYTIHWLPGYSPAEILGSSNVPTDQVVAGTILPDLQGDHLVQTGGGMMAYPREMAPVPGRYKTLDPMFPITKAEVDNLKTVRYPPTRGWLLHQWEDRPGGLIHRSTVLGKLPLKAPVSQQQFYSEHQLMEGQFWGTSGMRKAYKAWLSQQKKS